MKLHKTVAAVCIVPLLLSACATPEGGAPADGGASRNETAVRCAAMGLGGAVIGALISGGKGAARGAIAGLAACAVVEYASRQTKSSAEVDKQYRASNRNQLPPMARIDTYSTQVSPNGVAKAGDAIKVQSTIRAISGVNEPVQDVKEVLIAYAPTGEEFKRGEKKVNDASGSGEYDNSFTLRLPQGAPQGVYRLKTQVFLNGKPSLVRESNLQVAMVDGAPSYAMLDR
jgi:hypothetical protein